MYSLLNGLTKRRTCEQIEETFVFVRVGVTPISSSALYFVGNSICIVQPTCLTMII